MSKRRERLERVCRLRAMKAPLWIIRSEQVALALLRKGLKFYPIGKTASKAQGLLMERYVTPLMGKK